MLALALAKIAFVISGALLISTCTLAQAEQTEVEKQAQEIVENFRQTLVLHEAQQSRHTKNLSEAGQLLFYRNRALTAQLIDRLQNTLISGDASEVEQFLHLFDQNDEWHDADHLALAGVIHELKLRLQSDHPMQTRLDAALSSVAQIRTIYDGELTEALTDRKNPHFSRPVWQAYLSFLHEHYRETQILDALEAELPVRDEQLTPSPRGAAASERAGLSEWIDGGLPEKTLLLTFDDGPHPLYTPQVLAILSHFNIKAIFFEVGHNLGVMRNGHVAALLHDDLEKRIAADGHAVGNHSMSHPFMSKLDAVSVAREIDDSETLLAAAAPRSRVPLFRPPYGARNPLVLAEIAERGLRSVLWSIDSRDWADPIPSSIAHRVVQEAEQRGSGIILFHDIHGRTVQALPIALQELSRRGFKFAHWENGQLVISNGR